MFKMGFCRFRSMMSCMYMVSMRDVRMMRGLLVMSSLMVFRRFLMMTSCVLMMFGSFGMMFCCLF